VRYREIIREGIVYRDRIADSDGQRTVIAVNPTKAEWDKWFPKGAAGILCLNGKIVIGHGSMLAHTDILGYAKIPNEQEKYRLQLGRTAAFAELWIDDSDTIVSLPVSDIISGKTQEPWRQRTHLSEDDVRARVVKEYGETLEQIEPQIKSAVSRFMGDVPVKAIPLNYDQETLLPGDQAFINATFPRK